MSDTTHPPGDLKWNEAVKGARLLLGLTQKQLAKAIGLTSQSYISDVEAGRVQPSMEVVRKLYPLIKQAFPGDARQPSPRVAEVPQQSDSSNLHPFVTQLVAACRKLTPREVQILSHIARYFIDVRTELAEGLEPPLVEAKKPSSSRSPWRGSRNATTSAKDFGESGV